MASAGSLKWPLSSIGIPDPKPGLTGFGYKSSDPAVVCAFDGTNVVSASAPIDVAAIVNPVIRRTPAPTAPTYCFPLANQGGTYLDLFFNSIDVIQASAPSVRAFGLKFIKNDKSVQRYAPVDYTPAFGRLDDTTAYCPGGFEQGVDWVPLYHPSTGAHLQSWGTAPEVGIAQGGVLSTWYRTGGVSYFTKGYDVIIVLPVTAPSNLGVMQDGRALVTGVLGA